MRLKASIPNHHQKDEPYSPDGEGPHGNLVSIAKCFITSNTMVRGAAILTALLIVIQLLWPLPAQANLAAQPGYVFVKLNKGNPSGRFIVSNTGNEKQTYRARAMHFALTKEGSIIPVKPDDYSLAEWVKFNPKEFTLPPKSSRVIRFTVVRDESNLRPHEYWGAIEFTPLKGARFKSKADKKGRAMEFQVITALLIPIYGEMPGTVYGGRIKDISAEQSKKHLNLAAMVQNTGGGVLRATGTWQISAAGTGDLIKTIPVQLFTVFPRQERHLTRTVGEQLPPGRYSVKLSLKYHDGKTLSGQGEVEIP